MSLLHIKTNDDIEGFILAVVHYFLTLKQQNKITYNTIKQFTNLTNTDINNIFHKRKNIKLISILQLLVFFDIDISIYKNDINFHDSFLLKHKTNIHVINYLKAIKKIRKYTNKEIAIKLNLNLQMISKLLNPNYNIKFFEFLKLCNLLEIYYKVV